MYAKQGEREKERKKKERERSRVASAMAFTFFLDLFLLSPQPPLLLLAGGRRGRARPPQRVRGSRLGGIEGKPEAAEGESEQQQQQQQQQRRSFSSSPCLAAGSLGALRPALAPRSVKVEARSSSKAEKKENK